MPKIEKWANALDAWMNAALLAFAAHESRVERLAAMVFSERAAIDQLAKEFDWCIARLREHYNQMPVMSRKTKADPIIAERFHAGLATVRDVQKAKRRKTAKD